MKELISCIKNLPKHFKTSLVNLWRNGAMTFSSIFAVTITLLLIGVISVLALNVQDISSKKVFVFMLNLNVLLMKMQKMKLANKLNN